MSKLMDAIDRLVFGATTDERAERFAEKLVQRIDQRVTQQIAARLVEALDVEPGYDAVYDQAFDAALEDGLPREDAHREAGRLAEAWQARMRSGEVEHERAE